MGSSAQSPFNEALNQLWARFLPQIEERVAIFEAANRALAAGTLSDEERTAAAAAAHKLAGVLGTFGLAEGTDLAREAELAYSGKFPAGLGMLPRLEAIAQELTEMIRIRR
jgi:HPt (histidine-containing phosphotransfer) domain-containing protein